MPHRRDPGFALVDVLVALLLLAIVLTGTCAALIQAVRASGEALRTSRAADLAADLTEELRGASSVAQARTIVAAWRTRIPAVLPVAGLEAEEIVSLTAFDPGPSEGATTPIAPLMVLRLGWLAAGSEARELVLPMAGRVDDTP
jgi:type II secretory pathway pseudopilin PulG